MTDKTDIGSIKRVGDIFVGIEQKCLALEIADTLNDHKSLPFFRIVVSKFAGYEDSIYKCLSLVKETAETSGIRKSRGAVFTAYIKREAKKLKIAL